MAESTVSTNYYGYLEAVAGKGPCRDSESVYRSCKKIYKKMIGLCRQLPVSRYPDITGGRYILLSEDGSSVGSAPGLTKRNTMDELKGELTGHLQRLIESDRASSDRALD